MGDVLDIFGVSSSVFFSGSSPLAKLNLDTQIGTTLATNLATRFPTTQNYEIALVAAGTAFLTGVGQLISDANESKNSDYWSTISGDGIALLGDFNNVAASIAGLINTPASRSLAAELGTLGGYLGLAGTMISNYSAVQQIEAGSGDAGTLIKQLDSQLTATANVMSQVTTGLENAGAAISNAWSSVYQIFQSVTSSLSDELSDFGSNNGNFTSDAGAVQSDFNSLQTPLNNLVSTLPGIQLPSTTETANDNTETVGITGDASAAFGSFTESPDGSNTSTASTPDPSGSASTTITYTDSGTAGRLSSADYEDFVAGTSQITSYNSDGLSTTKYYTGLHGMGSVTKIDQENANGTSQITTYNADGSANTIEYKGPNGTGGAIDNASSITIQPNETYSFLSSPLPDLVTLGTAYISGTQKYTLIFPNSPEGSWEKVNSGYGFYDPSFGSLPGYVALLGTSLGAPGAYANALYLDEPYGDIIGGIQLNSLPPSAGSPNGATVVTIEVSSTPSISFVKPTPVGEGQTEVIGTAAPSVSGDMLTVTETQGAGLVSLGPVQADGTQQVIYVAPASVPASTADLVFYTISENGAGTTQGIAKVPLEAGPTLPGASITINGNTVTAAIKAGQTVGIDPLVTDFGGTIPTLILQGPGTADIAGPAAINNFEVASSGDLLLQGGTVTTDPVTVDAGGNISGFGTITGTETVNGTITASGGTLDITDNVSGSGTLTFAAGASLQLEGTVAASESLVFTGGNETLILGPGASVQANISGLTTGDVISLEGQSITSDVYDPNTNTLAIASGAGPTFQLNLVGTYQQSDFGLAGGAVEVTAPICYLSGTHILTPTGEVPIEELKIGDLVVTRFSGIQPIKWIGRQSYDARFIRHNRDHIPVCIHAGALADHMPARDLYVSPGHSMLMNDQLILARSLVNGVTITQGKCPSKIQYFQVELEIHDCVIAEGTWSETFADGPGLRDKFHNAAQFAELYPDQPPTSELLLCAARPEHGPKLDAALRPVVARTAVTLTPGPLRGYIDRIEAPRAIVGWAQDTDYPELPVLLEVLLGEQIIGTILACDHRQDLENAGIGQGRNGFFLTSPIRLRPEMLPTLRIRRSSDCAEIQMTPECRRKIEAIPQTQATPDFRRVA